MTTVETTIRTALGRARQCLAARSDTPDLDARLLLEHVLAAGTAYVLAHGEQPLEPPLQLRYEALIERRAAGEPVAYILGRVGFWRVDLAVDQRVLIPRPDTETLVDTLLARLDAGPRQIADLGTGSGAIALALAHERPNWQLRATDNDAETLACARTNAAALALDNIVFARGCWLDALDSRRFDAIVANPPYVATNDAHLRAPELGYEPARALCSGPQGLDDLTRIARAAPACLKPGGWLMLEHGAEQGGAVRRLLRDARLLGVETIDDLGARPRVTIGYTRL